KGWDARKRAYCLKIQPATGSFARNLIYSTKPALFYLPALISGIYITVTVALHKVSLTYRTCFQSATAFKQDRNVHHNLLRLI
ncbi:hypothetical protein PU690_00005, partial [Klebsiella pneumoniae]|uniref:hypothetical protein n=1 Tax=Klebsiella pneumoniae TaxID=573 RepID=UPI0038CF9119